MALPASKRIRLNSNVRPLMLSRPVSQSRSEAFVRLIHITIGLACTGVAGWFLLFVAPFNYYGFFGFAVLACIALAVGLFGDRRLVFWCLVWGGF